MNIENNKNNRSVLMKQLERTVFIKALNTEAKIKFITFNLLFLNKRVE